MEKSTIKPHKNPVIKPPRATRKTERGGTLNVGGTYEGGGRPRKRPDLEEAYDEVMSEEQNGIDALRALIRSLRNRAIKGDVAAAKILLEYGYGKAKAQIELSGSVQTGGKIKLPNGEEIDW